MIDGRLDRYERTISASSHCLSGLPKLHTASLNLSISASSSGPLSLPAPLVRAAGGPPMHAGLLADLVTRPGSVGVMRRRDLPPQGGMVRAASSRSRRSPLPATPSSLPRLWQFAPHGVSSSARTPTRPRFDGVSSRCLFPCRDCELAMQMMRRTKRRRR
jgi:hypothetical protein